MVSDDPNLVSAAGLVPVMRLGEAPPVKGATDVFPPPLGHQSSTTASGGTSSHPVPTRRTTYYAGAEVCTGNAAGSASSQKIRPSLNLTEPLTAGQQCGVSPGSGRESGQVTPQRAARYGDNLIVGVVNGGATRKGYIYRFLPTFIVLVEVQPYQGTVGCTAPATSRRRMIVQPPYIVNKALRQCWARVRAGGPAGDVVVSRQPNRVNVGPGGRESS